MDYKWQNLTQSEFVALAIESHYVGVTFEKRHRKTLATLGQR